MDLSEIEEGGRYVAEISGTLVPAQVKWIGPYVVGRWQGDVPVPRFEEAEPDAVVVQVHHRRLLKALGKIGTGIDWPVLYVVAPSDLHPVPG